MNYRSIEEMYANMKALIIRGVTFSLGTSNHSDDPMVLRGEVMDETVASLERIRMLDPDFVLLSKNMIRQFKLKEHVASCFLRKGYIVSHNADLTKKRPCALGEQIDCSTCGCAVPIIMDNMLKFDLDTFRVAAMMF